MFRSAFLPASNSFRSLDRQHRAQSSCRSPLRKNRSTSIPIPWARCRPSTSKSARDSAGLPKFCHSVFSLHALRSFVVKHPPQKNSTTRSQERRENSFEIFVSFRGKNLPEKLAAKGHKDRKETHGRSPAPSTMTGGPRDEDDQCLW